MKYYMDIDWGKYGITIPHCLAPWKAAFIQADGFVRPCCIYPPIMGNTNKKKLEVIWNDEPYRKLRLAMQGKETMPEICAHCHDSMRHIDIDWYLRYAIEERIDEVADFHQLEGLLLTLVKKEYMVLSAIYLFSKIHRKKGESNRELYCLLSCKSAFDSSEDHDRIETLRRKLCGQKKSSGKVLIDAVFYSRLSGRIPALTAEFKKMIGREYSSVDEYMKDIDALKDFPVGAKKRRKVMREYKFYNYPILLEKRMRYGDFLTRYLGAFALRARSIFPVLLHRIYCMFDLFRKMLKNKK